MELLSQSILFCAVTLKQKFPLTNTTPSIKIKKAKQRKTFPNIKNLNEQNSGN